MNKKYQKSLFIFRRDLRLEDNTGLLYALENSVAVICTFIFTPEQIKNNPYRSDHCLQFMIEALEDLEQQLSKENGKLYLFYDKPEKIVAACIEKLGIEAVIVNRDYTPYSFQRDELIENVCRENNTSFHSFDDLLLNPPEKCIKKDGKPYTIFTPFYRNAQNFSIKKPRSNLFTNYYSKPISFAETPQLYEKILPQRAIKKGGGREVAKNILKNLVNFSKYDEDRNYPAEDKTTRLSAHLKFTTFSPREIYWAFSEQLEAPSSLQRSLYWRDFFTSIAFYFPYVFKGAFIQKFNALPWDNNPELFNSWCQGLTGYPLLDAGMRQLNQTGFMHNRVRMVAASFLMKDLHIDWRWGEKYFAQKLVDYDPAVNNGNWQWAASTGCDAQPYFRIFNPWTQSLKFDPEGKYIKHFIPELAAVAAGDLHKWHLDKVRATYRCDYPAPIVDHTTEAKASLALYAKAAQSFGSSNNYD